MAYGGKVLQGANFCVFHESAWQLVNVRAHTYTCKATRTATSKPAQINFFWRIHELLYVCQKVLYAKML